MSGRKRGKQKRKAGARAGALVQTPSVSASPSALDTEPPAVAQAAPVAAGVSDDADAGEAQDSWSELERDFFDRGDELHGPTAVAAVSGSGGRAS